MATAMRTFLSFFACALLFATCGFTNAFPMGAGDCPGGKAAVGKSHTSSDASITTGSLEEGQIQVRINGRILVPGVKLVLQAGVEHPLRLSTTSDVGFKGFLIRLSGGEDEVDTTVALSSASPSVQEAFVGTSIQSRPGDFQTERKIFSTLVASSQFVF